MSGTRPRAHLGQTEQMKTDVFAGKVPREPAESVTDVVVAGRAEDDPPSPWELLPGTMVDDYRIRSRIGRGGAGTVYAAEHRLIGKKAAIKVIERACTRAEELDKLLREARSVNKICHPNIVDIFALGMLADGRGYIAMELLAGENLGDRMGRGDPLEPAQMISCLTQICDALDAAHLQGIVHRDLKPDNVFLISAAPERVVVKLVDFGLAKAFGPDGPNPRRSSEGLIVGTPLYLSPEQASGAKVDQRSDLYSLGVLMFEMILGQLPFDGMESHSILEQHRSTPPPSPRSVWPQIPPALDALIIAMLDKRPAHRPDLERIRSLLADPALCAGLQNAPGRQRSRRGPRSAGVPIVTAPATPMAIGRTRKVGEGPVRLALLLSAIVFSSSLFALLLSRSRAPARSTSVTAVARPEPDTLATAAPREGTLLVRVNVANAQISVDGRVAATAAQEVRIPVDTTTVHAVSVTAPGRSSFSRSVLVGTGAVVTIDVRLTPSPPAAAPPRRASPAAHKNVSRSHADRADNELLAPAYDAKGP